MSHALTFAVTLPALLAAHSLADHWLQTNAQALTKHTPGWAGRLADLRHVATHTLTLAVVLALVAWRLNVHYDVPRVAVALVLNAITHYVADRRTPVTALATWIGKGGWVKADPEAGYKLDQSWHITWLLITALIVA